MKNHLLKLCFLLLCFKNMNAQNRFDESVYDDSSYVRLDHKVHVKVNPTLILRGIYACGAEYKWHKNFAGNAYLGIAPIQDYSFGFIHSFLGPSPYDPFLGISYLAAASEANGPGFYGSLSQKFIFNFDSYEDRNNAFYMELEYRHIRQHFDLNDVLKNNTTPIQGSISDLSLIHHCGLLNLGFRFERPKNSVKSHEFYMGVGVRHVEFYRFDKYETQMFNASANYTYSTFEYRNSYQWSSQDNLMINLGYIFGF